MSRKYNMIITFLMIILMIILVCVMFNYYTSGKPIISNPVTTNVSRPFTVSGDVNNNEISKTPEIFTENSASESGEIQEDGEIASGEKSKAENQNLQEGSLEQLPEITVPTSNTQNNSQAIEKDNASATNGNSTETIQSSSPVIITSENEISSKEKREILGELDKTLMELLDVVDKVQIVDESRLPSDSEVGL